jgi:hypothetical protein
MERYAKKGIDSAGVIREAMFRHLTKRRAVARRVSHKSQ